MHDCFGACITKLMYMHFSFRIVFRMNCGSPAFSIKLKAQFYNWTTSLFSHLPHVATNLSEENDNAVLWWGECHFTKRRIINCTREDAEGGRAIQETMFLKKKAPSWGRGNLWPCKFEAHFLRLSAHWCIDWYIDYCATSKKVWRDRIQVRLLSSLKYIFDRPSKE